MAVDTVKRNTRQYEWQKENAERMNILFEKGTKARIDKACEVAGINKSEFVRKAVENELKKFE